MPGGPAVLTGMPLLAIEWRHANALAVREAWGPLLEKEKQAEGLQLLSLQPSAASNATAMIH
eukprot:11204720-Lingulodinium_polyedra.AAC.1